jgi:3-hydroxyisobutyrate dehydrogenase-like beta-hydroxyacid dehydrogenase
MFRSCSRSLLKILTKKSYKSEFELLGENGYLAGIKKGAVHINTTTITPDAATQLEKLHEQHGAYYVTGTVRII